MADKEIDKKDASAFNRTFGKYAKPGEFGFHLKEAAQDVFIKRRPGEAFAFTALGLGLGIPLVIAGHSVDVLQSTSTTLNPLPEDTAISTEINASQDYSIQGFVHDTNRYFIVKEGDDYRLLQDLGVRMGDYPRAFIVDNRLEAYQILREAAASYNAASTMIESDVGSADFSNMPDIYKVVNTSEAADATDVYGSGGLGRYVDAVRYNFSDDGSLAEEYSDFSAFLSDAARTIEQGNYGYDEDHDFAQLEYSSHSVTFEENDDSFFKFPGYFALLFGGLPAVAVLRLASGRRSRVRTLLKKAERGDALDQDDVDFLKQYYKVTAKPVEPDADKPVLPVRRSRSPK